MWRYGEVAAPGVNPAYGRRVALDADPRESFYGESRPDPLRHPDLEFLGRKLRDQYDEVLEAEQHAALAASRRLLTLRQRLIQAADAQETLIAHCTDGQMYRGLLSAVGADHVVVEEGNSRRYLALDHLVGVEFT